MDLVNKLVEMLTQREATANAAYDEIRDRLREDDRAEVPAMSAEERKRERRDLREASARWTEAQEALSRARTMADAAAAPRIEVVVFRDPDADTSIGVFVDGVETSVDRTTIDPGAGTTWADLVATREEEMATASPAAANAMSYYYLDAFESSYTTDVPQVSVRIANGYECGRESVSEVSVRIPHPGEDLDEWWNEVVHEHTGDGHPCGATEIGSHDVLITHAPDRPALVGETYSWEG